MTVGLRDERMRGVCIERSWAAVTAFDICLRGQREGVESRGCIAICEGASL